MSKTHFVEDEYHALTEDSVRDDCMEDRYGFDPAVIVPVEGGWHCFEYVTDYETWENQK